MYIEKVKIKNFKCFEDIFEVAFNQGVNIIVGNNEAGKSTLLEAIHLCLTGMLNGKYLRNELSPYLFNRKVERACDREGNEDWCKTKLAEHSADRFLTNAMPELAFEGCERFEAIEAIFATQFGGR